MPASPAARRANAPMRRRGPIGRMSDAALTAEICAFLAGSPSHVEGHRQVLGPITPRRNPHEVRATFERIRDLLSKLGAAMNNVVSIKTYLTDLGTYAVFSRIRGEFFPKDPPTSTAVQVAGLLLNAKIEIDAIAFLPAGPAA